MAPPRPNPKDVAREARKLPPQSRVEYVSAAIELVPVPPTGGAEPKTEPEPEQQLVKMRMAVLKRLALNCGLAESAIELAEQHDNPKRVLAGLIQKQTGWQESFRNSVEIGDGAPAVEVWRETALLYDLRAALHLEEQSFEAALADSDVSIVHAARAGAWSTGHEPHQRAALCCLRLGRLEEARRRVDALPTASLPLMVQLAAAERAVREADASIAAVSVEAAAAAAELLQKVCHDMCPGSASMSALLVSTLIMSRDWGAVDKALAAANRKHGSNNPQFLVVQGRVLAHNGDSAAAAELYQKAVKKLPRDDPQHRQADRLLREHNRRMRQWMSAKVDDVDENGDPVSRMGDYRDLRKRARAASGNGPRSPMSARDARDEAHFSARLWAAAEALGSGRPTTAAQFDAAAAEAGTVSADDYNAWRTWKQQGRDRAKQEETETNPSRRRERDQATALRRAQAKKVAAFRKERAEADQRASEKQELQRTISVKLQRKIAGRSFPKVLGAFGVPVPSDGECAPAAMAKAYKKALIKYHPDRAARQGADFSVQLEMEETYKLLQNLHQDWRSQVEAGGAGQYDHSDDDQPPPTTAGTRQGQAQEQARPQSTSAAPPRSWTEAGATGGPAARAAAAASVAARAARAAAAAASAHRASTASRSSDRAHDQALQREAAWRARWAAGAAREYGETGRPMRAAAAGGVGGGGAHGMPFKQRSAYF